MATLKERVTDLETDVAESEDRQMVALADLKQELKADIAALSKRMDERIDRLEKRLEKRMDDGFKALGDKIDGLRSAT